MPKTNKRLATAAWLLIGVQMSVVILLIVGMLRSDMVRFNSDILAVLPANELHSEAHAARFDAGKNRLYSRSQNQLVFSSEDKQALVLLKQRLQILDDLQENQVADFKLTEILQFYRQFPGSLSASQYPMQLNDKQALADYILAALTRPDGLFATDTLDADPTLSLAAFLGEALSAGTIQTEDGFLTAFHQQQKYYLLNYSVSHSYARAAESAALVDRILDLVRQISTSEHPIFYSGFLFHSVENAKNAEYEISLFGCISLLLLLLLLLRTFKSMQVLSLMVLTVANAGLWGCAALFWIFSDIQLIALVFAITLIGVAIDYMFHVVCAKQSAEPSLIPSLLLGFATTIFGYALFVFSPILLLQQVAVFMIFGLAGALFIALLSYYCFSFQKAAAGLFWLPWLATLRQMRLRVYGGASLLVGLLYLLSPLHADDDVKSLTSSSPQLLAQEQFNLTLLGQLESQFYLLNAGSTELALQQQEQIALWLQEHAPQAKLNSLVRFLPSLAAQQQNLQNLNCKITEQNFVLVSEQLELNFAPFAQNYLTPSDFAKSPLAFLLPVYVLNQDDYTQLWFAVDGITAAQSQALVAAFQNDVALVDRRAEISAALGEYRNTVTLLIALVALATVIVIAARFGLTAAMQGGVIIVLVVGIALSVSQWLQGYVTLFNFLAIILVLALAVDYLIFYLGQGLTPHNVKAISLSLLSSCFVFGILALSATPAVFSFGVTLLAGLLALYVLAPCIIKENNNE